MFAERFSSSLIVAAQGSFAPMSVREHFPGENLDAGLLGSPNVLFGSRRTIISDCMSIVSSYPAGMI